MPYEPIKLPDRVQLSEDEAIQKSQIFFKYMCKRHSVRDFSGNPISIKIIENIIATAGRAPSGANQQPWHFVAIKDLSMKKMIRDAAEKEEQNFYTGGASEEWISALEPIGTGISKPHLTKAPWLIVVFAERYGKKADGSRSKNYYVPESVGIAMGFLIAAIHNAGLVCLEHTPNPMKFLNNLCGRPDNEKPIMILPVGHPSEDANIPKAAKLKKPLDEISSIF
jgi:nitroreductase|tara:strand:- start:795 stop:1466 length:672 start_codon:yes stop_codon:yes gene_type:complete